MGLHPIGVMISSLGPSATENKSLSWARVSHLQFQNIPTQQISKSLMTKNLILEVRVHELLIRDGFIAKPHQTIRRHV